MFKSIVFHVTCGGTGGCNRAYYDLSWNYKLSRLTLKKIKNNVQNSQKCTSDIYRAFNEGRTQLSAGKEYKTTPQTIRKWVRRYQSEGLAGIEDRSSHPHNSPNATPEEQEAKGYRIKKERAIRGAYCL